ncbi:hypothetical protein BRE01_17820 [Brevibacillus reuszeri]|uniref:Uncharacterized protein n=1 Tax=Brevibacillus reuszeri TaxID=54915 RepID=A0A0K9Z0A9_9BACL|nr:hypothetical protein [Brevibacillus reuszeri]KNB74332.1 hypothetical protein ADS79_01095 [Brevibacillus reuszeri]MED1856231.1 hypothetical protein [Brevibacillus reuszeri]GED68080.1 hypothetical protein BRE01_17820 [Brevibacillus reuszeri]
MTTYKDDLAKKHAEQMNTEAVNRIKKQSEAEEVEGIFFEDDAKITLRDGKTYCIPPASLKDARILMKKLGTVHLDAIILNFLPSDNAENDLFDILLLGFRNYPSITRDYLDEYCDLETARKLINILIGLNGLKK